MKSITLRSYTPNFSMAMPGLTKFNPLSAISIPNVGRVTPRGLVLVAGPNSSGKSQMLKDIQARCTGAPRDLVVCNEIEITPPTSFDELLSELERDGALTTVTDQNGHVFLEQARPYLGGEGGSAWREQRHILEHHFKALRTNRPEHIRAFYNPIGKLLTTSLFLDRRLGTANETSSFDWQNEKPKNELQALYLSKSAREELTNEIQRVFGRAVWLDASRGTKLCLRVSDRPIVPPDGDRLQPEMMKEYRTVDSEGDGLRSYIAVCLSLLLGRRPVCLIDEPEMCLHPPQAYMLGRFIGRHGTSADHSTFVATHSSHVLRGIVEETAALQILRLSRAGSEFVGNLIPYDVLKSCIDRPSAKIETILDGIFSEAVSIVESEGDRAVYEAVAERLGEEIEHDVHFVSVGGVGGFASVAKLYRNLKIPTAVVADLDLIGKSETLQNVLESLTSTEHSSAIVAKARTIVQRIEVQPNALKPSDVHRELQELMQSLDPWDDGKQERVKRRLNDLANRLGRLSVLKRGGLASFEDQSAIRDDLRALLAECSRHGLFLVPVGELEYWCKDLMEEGPSRKKKSEWANEAAIRIRAAEPRTDDIWAFIKSTASYQHDQANCIAGYQR